jgi:hypothetical protein
MICPECNLVVRTGVRQINSDGVTPVSLTARKKNTKNTKKYRRHGPVDVQPMIAAFNKYWSLKYDMDIDFIFTDLEYRFITFSEPAILRNELLNDKMRAMGLSPHPIIIEPFAGCGADTISFLFNMNPTKIYVSEVRQDRIDQLRGNVTKFEKAMPDVMTPAYDVQNTVQPKGSIVSISQCESRDIFTYVNEENISLLYLDPPWTVWSITGKAENNELDAGQLLDYLNDEVFSPMLAKKIKPKLIVIKTRFDWKELKKVMHQLPKKDSDTNEDLYIQTDTIYFQPLKSTVYFHTLQTTECTVHQWEKSSIQGEIYGKYGKGGQSVDGEGRLSYVESVLA